ncbi:F-box/kelch-repeat protein At3g06240-like [Papaver somniferum]|uniref:F-box/kelch-repeat protein At3g06240-like n=1 Tax=Papaver somniferum TaxID=3469 RepID=UPI000E6FF202|nr:F-box/kelch-repeat protein At3g06240-like [Papaver somniferum]
MQLDHPSPYEAGIQFGSIEFDILGSCDGLICLGLYRASPIDLKEINNICVWNPITREYKNIQIRPPYFYHSILNVTTYGFGYDSSVDDYKFVRIVYPENCNHSQLEVYTLGSGLWKAIEEIPYTFRETTDRPGLLLNGALHWLCTAKNTFFSSEVIFSFDISNARLIDVPIPEETMEQEKHVGVLTDNLCLMSSARSRIDVWVMMDYGVDDSWAKLFNFKSYNLELTPLWIRNSEILLAIKNEFVSYDPKDDKLQCAYVFAPAKNYLELKKSDNAGYCYYLKSLVSLKSGTCVEKRIVERDRKKRKLA